MTTIIEYRLSLRIPFSNRRHVLHILNKHNTNKHFKIEHALGVLFSRMEYSRTSGGDIQVCGHFTGPETCQIDVLQQMSPFVCDFDCILKKGTLYYIMMSNNKIFSIHRILKPTDSSDDGFESSEDNDDNDEQTDVKQEETSNWKDWIHNKISIF